MPRRFGRPGLLGTIARTAVISGTATAVSNRAERRDMQRQMDSQPQQMPPAQAPAPPPAAPASGTDRVAQLTQLAELRIQGVFAGMVVFAAIGITQAAEGRRRAPRRAYVMLGLLFTAVLLPLGANTVTTVLLNNWTSRTKSTAQRWLSHTPGASVTSVEAQSRTLYVHVRSPGGLPPLDDLLSDLEGAVPDGVPIVVDSTRGERIAAGKVGG
ncbi:hypothetical protein [Streptomyces sp. SM10]|uniref:hypothetical protein n=1 Tax=Streptomyces sp. SM10 TaxID=565556 RepID=UPI000CD50BD3|nr:hypothetical protein [Streptomyces sp. SM10]